VTGSPTLASRTTLRVGGPAARWVAATTPDELIRTVRACDEKGEPVLLLGGGSNVVVADEGFPGTVIEVALRGIQERDGGDSVLLTVAAGEPWDDLVAHTVRRMLHGIESLSGIPGSTGATPIQNVGAYGQELADVIADVHAWDRATASEVYLTPAECGFGYRTSRFKAEPDRWVILDLTLRLRHGDGVVRYGEVASFLGVEVGAHAPVARLRETVLALRSAKGMVLDQADHDTWSVGSFFTNPVVGDDVLVTLPGECPRYAAPGGTKVSAAWLIEAAGAGRGFALGEPPRATVSSKHSLALTNRGTATTADILDLARAVRASVHDRFGIELVPEPTLVGCRL
jgi:UDP-N-acetylmuramate dehydrogenase